MSFDTRLFGDKLRRLSEQAGFDVAGLAAATGISADRLASLRDSSIEPSGDEILILADVFKIDFKFFVSGDAQTPFGQMEILYRKFGDRIGAADRRAVAELLYLCDTEQDIQSDFGDSNHSRLTISKRGNHYKTHGEDAARDVRKHLALDDATPIGDVFAVARRLGIHVFRRRLRETGVSGLTIRHPHAGPCVLVNFAEDPYRQRFTLAHELAHVFLDAEEDVVVSFARWDRSDLREIRANSFASHLLVPRGVLQRLQGRPPSDADFVRLAHRLEVNAETLAFSMADADLISTADRDRLRRIRLPRADKKDTEVGPGLTDRQRARKQEMIEIGLSQFYVELCFDAYAAEKVSRGRLAEALLVDEGSLTEIASLFGRKLLHA